MNRLVLLSVAIWLLPGPSGAQQPQSDDPQGWTKAKWGMTESEIRKLFPEAFKIDDSRKAFQFLGLHDFQIDNLSYTVKFLFDQSGLGQVELSPERDPAIVADVAQSYLLGILRDKYGQPLHVKDEELRDPPGKLHKWEWMFPTTVISLQYGDYLNRKYAFLFMVYHRRERRDVI